MAISPRTFVSVLCSAPRLPLRLPGKHLRGKAAATCFGLISACCLLPSAFLLDGCHPLFPNAGSGTHLDPQEKTPSHRPTAKAATVRAEVTTDAANQVVLIRILRSSGSGSVDDFVADSIRQGFPAPASTRSVVEINYHPGSGFSDPKIISTVPASAASPSVPAS